MIFLNTSGLIILSLKHELCVLSLLAYINKYVNCMLHVFCSPLRNMRIVQCHGNLSRGVLFLLLKCEYAILFDILNNACCIN